MSVLLLSTYDLGRQPFGLASPAAWLRRAGLEVRLVDLSRQRVEESVLADARFAGLYLPMHTATRLALPVIDRIKAANPGATICAFGLYAALNERLLRERGADVVLGPEFEADLVAAALGTLPAAARARPGFAAEPTGGDGGLDALMSPISLPKLHFIAPDRSGLPGLDRYAALQMPDGSRRLAGATEATRGCKHRCRHCPIVPVYDGAFRVVPLEVVLADVRAQVERGAEHITFGDPDFFNGPTHARRLVEALHAEWPGVTYDATIKVEHLLAHRGLLGTLVSTGCLFVTTAVESLDDAVLAKLEKGHSRADVIDALRLSKEAGLALAPTFVAFTPWTSLASYLDMLDTVEALDLVDHVAPVQWSIRLLITEGSRLLELEDIRRRVSAFDPVTLAHSWTHLDPRIDALQQRVMTTVGVHLGRPRRESFAAVRALASDAAGAVPRTEQRDRLARAAIPYLNEPWYC
ncbi:MAG: CUAEP/CCAEP-tail radical SAM (seleno)protein [Vicinamibacterales bacterium]